MNIRCACGVTLVDEVGEGTVTVAGRTFDFRRATDYVVCRGCGELRSLNQIADDTAAAEAADDVDADAVLTALHELADEEGEGERSR